MVAPTWASVLEASGLNEADGKTALKLLRSKAIVDIDWGGRTENVDHPDNRISVRL